MEKITSLTDSDFSMFKDLLIEESGLNFDRDRSQSLAMALNKRLKAKQHATFGEYYNYIKFHPEGEMEMRELVDLLTIGETFFYRNTAHFDILAKTVLPEMIQKKRINNDRKMRIWSAGCSTGDEPYSIAITLNELLADIDNWKISILATDINRNALVNALEGVYRERNVSYMPEGFKNRYFKKKGMNYLINDNIKKLVSFQYHNLVKEYFYMDKMQDLDIIFCRNVTIYFDQDTTKKVIEKFYDCLNRNGLLFIGHAETLWQITEKFETIMYPQTFIYKKSSKAGKGETSKPFIALPEIKIEKYIPHKDFEFPKQKEVKFEPVSAVYKEPVKPANLESLYKEAVKYFNEKKYSEALKYFNEIIRKDKNHKRAYFIKATILSNQGNYKEAVEELKKIIKIDNLFIEAYYLLGVIAYQTGDLKEAEGQFKKVVYIDHTIALAYYNLGNIYLAEKKYQNARREFNNALKLLKDHPTDQKVRFSEDLTLDDLLMAVKNHTSKIDKINE